MTEEIGTTTVASAPQEGSPEASQIHSSTMQNTEGTMAIEGETGKVTGVPEEEFKWSWQEGLPGEGKRPDWISEKYDSVEAQARANNDAQELIGKLKNQLGKYADWHAPEAYDFSEITGDDFAFNKDSAEFKGFTDLMHVNNIPNELANQLAQLYKADQMSNRIDPAEEIKAIGPDAQQQFDALNKWRESYSDETSEFLRKTATTAEAIRAYKEIRATNIQTSVPTGIGTAPTTVTKEMLLKQYGENLYKGDKIADDPDKQREWVKKIKEFV
jgi:hypothetical protein